MALELYSDGGVVKSNPSKIGGTWAWCLVKDNELIAEASGIIQPRDFGVKAITNNQTELLAAIEGMEWAEIVNERNCPKPWKWDNFVHPVLFTDSRITQLRLTSSNSFAGIPQALRLRALELRRCNRWRVILVAGHPTKKELAAGFRKRNGLPVSKWNVRCDEACRKAGKSFLRKLAEKR